MDMAAGEERMRGKFRQDCERIFAWGLVVGVYRVSYSSGLEMRFVEKRFAVLRATA